MRAVNASDSPMRSTVESTFVFTVVFYGPPRFSRKVVKGSANTHRLQTKYSCGLAANARLCANRRKTHL